MKKKLFLLCTTILCMCLLTGCSCEHEWMAATCTTAKTCSICGDTDGEALSHDWVDANCEHPKTCNRCNLAEGDVTEHALGEWTESVDYIHAETYRAQFCSICGAVINSETVPVEDFADNGTFSFTPREFVERFVHIASETMENVSYTVIEDSDNLHIGISLGEKRAAVFSFYDYDIDSMTKSDIDSARIGAFSFSYAFELGPLTWSPEMDEFTDYNVLIFGDVFAEALIRTCEPVATKETVYGFQSIGFTAGTGSAEWVESDTYMLESATGIAYYIKRDGSSGETVYVDITAMCI